jgi:EAL domain-containing protein (putative c-di-GMP-specific phosphodiesterase class I)
MGVQLSIDDFGTGYSSMEQLKITPVNELKIDKSFVLELISSHEDAIIVKSITDLAHNLGLSVVAEGVENKESLDMLREIGVETAQGYYISKAIHGDEFLPWLVKYEEDNA